MPQGVDSRGCAVFMNSVPENGSGDAQLFETKFSECSNCFQVESNNGSPETQLYIKYYLSDSVKATRDVVGQSTLPNYVLFLLVIKCSLSGQARLEETVDILRVFPYLMRYAKTTNRRLLLCHVYTYQANILMNCIQLSVSVAKSGITSQIVTRLSQ